MILNPHKVSNALRYPGASVQKLIRRAKQRLDPDWLLRLEQAAARQIQWVSPRDIRFVSRKKFAVAKTGQVAGGEWDELSLPFDRLNFDSPANSRGNRRSQQPLSVNIGRHGDFLLNEGDLGLAVAKLLDLPRVPITITARHRQWVQFKRDLVAYTRQQPNSALYAPLFHPDLTWIPVQRGHERFELIQSALLSRGGTMLDIGCNLGYFCHRFEDIGFTCTGVEFDPTLFGFLEKLKRASSKNFQTVNGSIFDYVQQESRPYEVVLALAVFHHFVKSESLLHQLKNLLAQLNARELYFQPPHPWETQMQGVYWNPSADEFVAFILEHSNLNQATYLGRPSGGRPVYRLTV